MADPLDLKSPATWIATWFGCGLMRRAPGTWGTLGALPFGVALMFAGGWAALLIGLAVIIPLGLWATHDIQKKSGNHDGGFIVIDEVAGMWITLMAAQLTGPSVVLAFILFRTFDILKPWPISWVDKNISGAAGVMADDILAGIVAAICLMGIHHYVDIG